MPTHDEIGELGQMMHTIRSQKQALVEAERLLDEMQRQAQLLQSQRSALAAANVQLAAQKREVEQKAAELTQVSQYKSEFLANMSHEMRTPLNAIIGLTGLAMNHELPVEVRDYLGKIQSSSNSLLRIINDILDLSKIEAGKLELEPVAFNLRDLFDNLGDMFRQVAIDKDIELNVWIPQSCPIHWIGDNLRISQILMNLLSNAIKFTQKGEIALDVVALEATTDRIRLQFSVRDTGLGLSEEAAAKLFRAFSQANRSITRQYGGTGLGLSISRQLVEMMGGQIWVESTLGQGSRFCFTLELDQQPTQRDTDLSLPEAVRHIKILVVEDNETARFILDQTLRAFQWQPALATSGQEALAMARTAALAHLPYDLVFMDWQLPDMDGIQTTKLLLEMLATPLTLTSPKVVMLTAHGSEAVKRRAARVGVDLFLQKPVSRSQLFNAIMDVFGHDTAKVGQAETQSDISHVSRTIGGAKVLLVEDNAINRDVARGVLEHVGIVVDEAHNGAEAVQLVKKNHYDAVLMDIQMPVMDGVTATGHIRRDQRCQTLPIIAMTARAMEGDRQKSLAAGMNDHVAKPIHNPTLYAVLAKWIHPTGSHARFGKAPQQNQLPSQDGLLPARLDGFDLTDAMERFANDSGRFRVFLLAFQENYADSAQDIRAALDQGDSITAVRLAHSMNGVAGHIAAKELQQAAVDLEQTIEQGTITADSVKMRHFEAALERVMTSIGLLTTDSESSAPPAATRQVTSQPIDKTKVGPLLIELANLLADDNADALDSFAALRHVLEETAWHSELHKLGSCIDRVDYQQAAAILSTMALTLDIPIGSA